MQQRHEFYYLLAATILTRLPWVFMVPMFEAPDENTHYWVFRFMIEHGSLPGPADIALAGKEGVYGPLPQFGYLPHILTAVLLSSVFDPSVAPRIGSLLLAPVLTYAGWRLGKLLFPSSRRCALALPLLIVFHPQLVLTFCYSNNDVTSSTLAAVLLLIFALMLQKGLSIKLSMVAGVLAGWLLLSKYTGYAVLPAVAFAFLACAWIHRSSLKTVMTCGISIIGLAAALSGWWFVRNYSIFGDALGMQTMRRQWATIYDKPLSYYRNPLEIALDYKWWRYMFYCFWGHFGYLTRPLPKLLYHVYTGFLTLSILGLSVALYRAAISGALRRLLKNIENDRPSLIQPALWLTMAICYLANLAAVIWSSSGNIGGPVGRYLFTSEIPALAFLTGGLHLLGGRGRDWLLKAFVGFNIFVYIWSFAMLFQAYDGFRWRTF